MNFNFLQEMEDATASNKNDFFKFGVVIIFMILVMIMSYNSMGELPTNMFLVIAALFCYRKRPHYQQWQMTANTIDKCDVISPGF